MNEPEEMEPLRFDLIETAKMIRRYLRREYPEREFLVRSYRFQHRRSGPKWTAIIVMWNSMPRDGDIKDFMGNFEMYDLDFDGISVKYHYIDQEGRIYSTWNRALFPPKVQEIVFENNYVWTGLFSTPWQQTLAYRRRMKAGREICAPCPPQARVGDISPAILEQMETLQNS